MRNGRMVFACNLADCAIIVISSSCPGKLQKFNLHVILQLILANYFPRYD